jgi:hypothetical protein
MRAGSLRGKASIESPTTTRDASGGVSTAWALVAERRCSRIAGGAKSTQALAQRYTQMTDVFVFRYEAAIQFLPSWRLVYGGLAYRIIAAETMFDKNQETRVITEREIPGTKIYGN